VTITLQALSLVEKVELVEDRFTLRSRDQQGPTQYVNARWMYGIQYARLPRRRSLAFAGATSLLLLYPCTRGW
jgi:hypothetical protein